MKTPPINLREITIKKLNDIKKGKCVCCEKKTAVLHLIKNVYCCYPCMASVDEYKVINMTDAHNLYKIPMKVLREEIKHEIDDRRTASYNSRRVYLLTDILKYQQEYITETI